MRTSSVLRWCQTGAMNTLSDEGSTPWSSIAAEWPGLDWTDVTFHHGAFHHVVVLGRSTDIRVASGTDHQARIAREPLKRIIAGIFEADVELGALPKPRQWCGGADWPAIVGRVTGPLEQQIRDASAGVVRDVLDAESSCEPMVVHGDFGLHNVLWNSENTPGVIDFDNACAGDPAIDIAPLVGSFGSGPVSDIADTEILKRARIHRASLPLQVASAAELAGDVKLKDHALGNFITRYRDGSLYDHKWGRNAEGSSAGR